MPRPTKLQLRQHALDRALQPDVVQSLTVLGDGVPQNIDEFGDRITTMAGKFEAYLSEADEDDTPSDVSNRAPDGAPWYAHMDGPCGPECQHAPDGGNHPRVAGT
jgi:hypothetical protein